jgi:acetyltransferase-like isoleucine patch superfamily enzyme
MKDTLAELEHCQISPEAVISPDARIHPSVRGSKLVIGAHTHIYDFAVIRFVGGSGDIIIGEHCYINPHCVLYSGNGIVLGNYVLIAPGTAIVPANHSIARRDTVIRLQGFSPSRGGVTIEDDVWIGANCVLLDGTHIEKGAVVAAGSVVSGRIPEYTIWGGVPAKMIKARD